MRGRGEPEPTNLVIAPIIDARLCTSEMADKTNDEAVRETFRKYRPIFFQRLPIETLPRKLEHEGIISKEELVDVQARSNTVKQREKLVEILQTKDAGALLRVVKILETQECGYEDLAKDFFADLDKMQTDKYKQAVRLTIDQPQTDAQSCQSPVEASSMIMPAEEKKLEISHCGSQATCRCLDVLCAMLMIALLVFLFVSRLPGEISDAGQCKDGVKDSSNDAQSEDDDVCTACNNLHVGKNWVARDGCDAWYHFGCTSLEAMPGAQDQWLCEDCLNCEDSLVMLKCTDCHQQTEKSIH